jgi:hypothetical protein
MALAEVTPIVNVKIGEKPFDPRTEVSADAKYIVKRLVQWFFVVPIVLALLVTVIYNIGNAIHP